MCVPEPDWRNVFQPDDISFEEMALVTLDLGWINSGTVISGFSQGIRLWSDACRTLRDDYVLSCPQCGNQDSVSGSRASD